MLVTHRPGLPLSRHVESLWFASRATLPHARERSLPTGCVDIVIPLLQDGVLRFDSADSLLPHHIRGGVVNGARDRYAVRGTGGASEVIGVHFRPGGAAPFFGGALSELQNLTVPLDALWGPLALELRERLQSTGQVSQKFRVLEGALLSRMLADKRDPFAEWAWRQFEADPTAARIDSIQRAANCSPKQFIQRIDAAFGLAPKRLARVLRFNAMLPRIARVGPRDWSGVAVENGYFDQSHLIHEFKRLAGVTPAAYLPLSAEQPTHVPIIEPPHRAGRKKSPIR